MPSIDMGSCGNLALRVVFFRRRLKADPSVAFQRCLDLVDFVRERCSVILKSPSAVETECLQSYEGSLRVWKGSNG